MKQSRRARRMETRNSKKSRIAPLNLISLMDIFTILVFFLLVQSAAQEVLPSTDTVQLPESIADTKARETVVVMLTKEQILVDGTVAMTMQAALAQETPILDALKASLESRPTKMITVGGAQEESRGEVVIMADKSLPYTLIKRIMKTCTQANYAQVSFAVLQVGEGSDA